MSMMLEWSQKLAAISASFVDVEHMIPLGKGRFPSAMFVYCRKYVRA